MSEGQDSTRDLVLSAIGMLGFGLIMFAAGGLCGVMLAGVTLGYGTLEWIALWGFGGLVGVGGGAWLMFCGARVLYKLAGGRRDFDE